MFKRTILSVFLLGTLFTYSQVGIGTTSPAPGSILDISSPDKGILIPRVALTATSVSAPIAIDPSEGLIVYNTATINDVSPGFYYWTGNKWLGISEGNNWKLTGNGGTTPGTNFLGTTDAIDLKIATNNLGRITLKSNGQTTIGFGNNSPNPNEQLGVTSTFTNGVAIGGYSGGSGRGIYGQNIASGIGVHGVNQGSGTGVRGEKLNTGGIGVYGIHTGGGDAIVGTTNSVNFSAVWGNNTNSNGTAILGGSGGVNVLTNGGSGISGSSPKLGIFGYAGNGNNVASNYGNAAGRFRLGTNSQPTTEVTRATAVLAGFDNVAASGTDPITVNLPAANSYFGGYFSGGTGSGLSYSYVGLKHNADINGAAGTNYKIIGPGSVSTLINDSNGIPRILFAPEATEILFQDYGVGQLVNGKARINLDPVLKGAIYVDENYPLKVFVSVEGECNGVYVTDKSIDGFTVKELNGGKSNVAFSWEIVANRADDKDSNGNITSKHVGLRLPVGPGPLKEVPLLEMKDLSNDDN